MENKHKKIKTFVFISIAILLIHTCQKNGKDKAVPESKQVKAICIWDRTAVRETPQEKGKWLASLNVGEKVLWLGDTSVDSTDEETEYLKVELSDGIVGWAKSYLLIPNATLGAILEEAPIYERPDVLSLSDKRFEMMNMVAITDTKNDWVEVIGEQKRRRGWIHMNKVTTDSIDVAVAILATKALEKEDGLSKQEKIQTFIESTPFPDSYFISKLKQLIPETIETEDKRIPTLEM
jgi:hypothetical protein